MGDHPVPKGAKAVDWKALAAPDLYDTLKEVRFWIDVEIDRWDAQFVAKIDAVLAKAEGNS